MKMSLILLSQKLVFLDKNNIFVNNNIQNEL